jgi:sec-independent protein translocase protein TatA
LVEDAMPSLGMPELVVILFIILLVFGAGRLTEVGTSLGKGIREFRNATADPSPAPSPAPDPPAPAQGAAVEAPAQGAAVEAPRPHCPHCGRALAANDAFCGTCGTKLGA